MAQEVPDEAVVDVVGPHTMLSNPHVVKVSPWRTALSS